MTTQLRNTFWHLFYTPHCSLCLCSILLFFLCGEDQIERVRRQFKGQTQVPASRAFTSVLTESRVNHWEMFHRSRDIMQRSESHIKLFTYSIIASLLLSSTPADKSATPGPLESLTTQNVSFNYCNSLGLWNMKINVARVPVVKTRTWIVYTASGTVTPHFIWWEKTNTGLI